MELKEIEIIENITLYTGPMYAGKSTKIIEIAKSAKEKNEKIICFKHNLDDERFGKDKIVARTKEEVEACSVSTTKDIITKIKDIQESVDSILIDELQFFGINLNTWQADNQEIENFVEMLRDFSKKGIKIILAGLNKTFENKYFPITKILIGDGLIEEKNIRYLTAECSAEGCCYRAEYTARIVSDKELVVVGDGDKYKAVCEKHHDCCNPKIKYKDISWKNNDKIKKKSNIKKSKERNSNKNNEIGF